MYYRNEMGELIENPIWYNVINGSLIVNLRKLKLIFNKGEKGQNGSPKKEEVFEFIITKVSETHTDGQLHCEVTAEGLAFQELGKVGYKISLSSQDFLDEYQEWYETEVGEGKDFSTQALKDAAEPKNNINYWCEKIFKNSHWDYEIQMDWSGFDGVTVNLTNAIREQRGLRRTDKIYEEEYVSSWEHIGTEEDGRLVPSNMEAFAEKLRLVDLEKSNIYNLTQNLAETFGVFCKYHYDYDENYHIVGKKCIFYNNFLSEKDGKLDIIYPYGTSKIVREIDSADVVTKMYVTPIEDTTTASGLVTIADVVANKAREDYILNFDYLYAIGTITQEQYDYIQDYERAIYLTNIELEPIASQMSNLQNELVKYEAQLKVAQEAKAQDLEQMEQAQKTIDEIMGEGNSYLYKNKEVPLRGVLLKEEEPSTKYYIKITQEGVDTKSEHKYPLTQWSETVETDEVGEDGKKKTETIAHTIWAKGIRLFYYKWKNEATKEKVLVAYDDDSTQNPDKEEGSQENPHAPTSGIYPPSAKLDVDDNQNLYRISNLELKPDALTSSYFVTCAYTPSLYYQNIYDTYERKLAKDEALEAEAEAKIAEINATLKVLQALYKAILDKKADLVADFENLMGPALREGSWQADNYTDYGSKYTQEVTVGGTSNSLLSFEWDSIAFDEEQLLYYEEGVEQNKTYYYAIDLSNCLEQIKNNLQDLSFIYDQVRSEDSTLIHQMTINSQAQFAFANLGGVRKPLLLLLDKKFKKTDYSNFRLGTISSTTLNNPTTLVSLTDAHWIPVESLSSATQVFPRLKIASLGLKTSEDELIIKYGNETLRNYYDYSVLVRGENHYITLKNELMLRGGIINGKKFNVAYAISNASLSLYLDALEVSKTNAFPQVSYELEISALNRDFIDVIYQHLNRVVSITDTDLKLDDVHGYISEIELDLENPWEDSVTVKNYKTKFEDLFSSIVASTEQMKTNSFAYNNAAGAFTSGGTLKPSVIQNTLNQVDLTYAFQSGNLTIDEINGIWARSDAGVVAMRGGGIFCATETDSNGNWIWNTGIMPSGINASLITAGQIDTNLIKIFAGDNLRLQLNAEGLFAYKVNDFGSADLNRYIVHNSEGLFSTVVNGSKKTHLVEVSWDGFFIRDENNVEKFSATPDGNLTITGKITATSGKVGPWNITERGLSSEDGYTGLVCAPKVDEDGKLISDYYEVFWATGVEQNGKQNKCYITNDGTLFCNNIRASGFISSNSFIGNTSGDEINGALKNISLSYDGARFSFDNRNYDGNLVVEPATRYLFVNKNALSDDEFGEPDKDFAFYYNITIDENTGKPIDGTNNSNWKEINLTDEDLLIWKPESLTFIIKDDIMYLDEEKPNIPVSSIYFKVTKIGKKRKVDENTLEVKIGSDGKPEMEEEPVIYSSIVQFFAENHGVGKYITPMEPQSYTFLEDQNNEIFYWEHPTQDFFIRLDGFTTEEEINDVLENAYWRIEGEEIQYKHYLVGMNEQADKELDDPNASAIYLEVDEEETVSINGIEVEGGDTLNANKERDSSGEVESDQDKLTVRLQKNDDGTLYAIATIGYDKVPEGGNVAITFCLHSATRTAYCFRQRNGQDSINIVMRSSSGSTLTTGDLSTTLSADLYYGMRLANEGEEEQKYFYVWKENGIALSSFKRRIVVETTNESTAEITKQEAFNEFSVQNGVPSAGFFKQKSIYITAADFGLKSDYRCDIFTDEQSAKDEYLLNNKNGDEVLYQEKKE